MTNKQLYLLIASAWGIAASITNSWQMLMSCLVFVFLYAFEKS